MDGKRTRRGMCLVLCIANAAHADFGITSLSSNGDFSWANAYTAGVLTVETATNLSGPFVPMPNVFSTTVVGSARMDTSATRQYTRLKLVDISTNTPFHFTNLVNSYGILELVAGKGVSEGDTNQWSPTYEGDWATNVGLSRPHIAFGDSRSNVLIVDQRSSSVLRVSPDGRIHTYAGTHVAGDNGDGPGLATNLQLRNPNSGWLGTNDVFYVLDTENGKVRKIATNGIMSTLFTTTPMGDGRALWVNNDESQVYFGSGSPVTNLNRWTPTGGVTVVRHDFQNLGNIRGNELKGYLYITDRSTNLIYRMDTKTSVLTVIAGNGTQSGGGDGFPALQTGLILPRCIAFLPNGGYFTCEHSPGNRIWYVDPAGIMHLWMNGNDNNNVRVGDGQWFFANPTNAKVSRVRSVIPDPFGNLIIVESNYGYVHRIRFQRMNP